MPHPLLIMSPYPYVEADGTLHDGFQLKQPTFCRNRCSSHDCSKYAPSASTEQFAPYTCPFGYSVLVASAANLKPNYLLNRVCVAASGSSQQGIRHHFIKGQAGDSHHQREIQLRAFGNLLAKVVSQVRLAFIT